VVIDHGLLEGMQVVRGADAFAGEDFPALEGDGGEEAGVDGTPGGVAVGIGVAEGDGAGAAVAFGTALLAAGEALLAEELEESLVRVEERGGVGAVI
jgi:hypothetical protein